MAFWVNKYSIISVWKPNSFTIFLQKTALFVFSHDENVVTSTNSDILNFISITMPSIYKYNPMENEFIVMPMTKDHPTVINSKHQTIANWIYPSPKNVLYEMMRKQFTRYYSRQENVKKLYSSWNWISNSLHFNYNGPWVRHWILKDSIGYRKQSRSTK